MSVTNLQDILGLNRAPFGSTGIDVRSPRQLNDVLWLAAFAMPPALTRTRVDRTHVFVLTSL